MYQQPWPQQAQQQYQAPPRKRRRVFLWVFLAVQALFVLLVVLAVASGHGTAANCQNLTQRECADAGNAGTALGAGIVVVLWMVADFLLGAGYGVYRLARRPG